MWNQHRRTTTQRCTNSLSESVRGRFLPLCVQTAVTKFAVEMSQSSLMSWYQEPRHKGSLHLAHASFVEMRRELGHVFTKERQTYVQAPHPGIGMLAGDPGDAEIWDNPCVCYIRKRGRKRNLWQGPQLNNHEEVREWQVWSKGWGIEAPGELTHNSCLQLPRGLADATATRHLEFQKGTQIPNQIYIGSLMWVSNFSCVCSNIDKYKLKGILSWLSF